MARDESRSAWDVRTSAFGRFWRTDAPPPPERVLSELLQRRFASTRLPGISRNTLHTQRLRAEPRKAVLNPRRCFPFLLPSRAVYWQVPLVRVACVWRARRRAIAGDTPVTLVQPTEHSAEIALPNWKLT
eukprot:IDg21516t1